MTGYAHRPLPVAWRPVAWLALLALALQPGLAVAQAAGGDEGVLAPGDTVTLVVPGRPELEQELQLDQTGEVDVTQVGAVQLGGLTRDEATQLLRQKLRLFYPTLDSIELTWTRGGQVRIYVIGAVHQRGVLNFQAEPTLWEVLRTMGGLRENANLRSARVIRDREGAAPEVFPVDLRGVMDGSGMIDFALRDGDTLVVPVQQEGIPDTSAADGVKVFGGVAVPTVVPVEGGTPLLDVLMLAGAPTEDARMEKVNWVHMGDGEPRAQVVDLKAYLLEGNAAGNPLVYPGDTVHVQFDRPSWVAKNVPFILGSLAAVATIALAWDRVVNDN